jgi:hypothetical protein
LTKLDGANGEAPGAPLDEVRTRSNRGGRRLPNTERMVKV